VDLHDGVSELSSRVLDRVKRLLGASWNSPEHALEVQLALRLHRIRG
jgi:hypothetical protein